jgi:hypothetical protein
LIEDDKDAMTTRSLASKDGADPRVNNEIKWEGNTDAIPSTCARKSNARPRDSPRVDAPTVEVKEDMVAVDD